MIEPGQDLYHGTYHRFAGTGREVWPGHATNHPGRTMDVNAEHVYATTDLTAAYTSPAMPLTATTGASVRASPGARPPCGELA